MGYAYPANVGELTIDATVYKAKLVHYTHSIGARPSEAQFLLLEKTPNTISNSTLRGKTATFKVDSVTKLSGKVYRIGKRFADLGVVVTVLDNRQLINSTYVGSDLLEQLDSNGLPTGSFAGLAYYGADIVFNLNGKPNQSKTTPLTFVAPGYEHNTAYANYWTYGQAIEWLLTRYCSGYTISPATPSGWAWGGWDKKMDELALFGVPVAEAIDQICARTRATWWLKDTTLYFASIDNPTASAALVIPDPAAPIAPDGTATDRPIDIEVEESVDDTTTILDIVGGKQQREVLLASTDWTQTQWYGINIQDGWYPERAPLLSYYPVWSNYDTELYRSLVLNNYGWITAFPASHVYRYNLNPDIFESHKIGTDLDANSQPYKILPTLLVARDKNGNFINPDQENAYDGVSPLELASQQYPDGFTLDMDRGFAFGRGYGPFTLSGLEQIIPPTSSLSNPSNLTLAFECSYRAYQSANVAITGVPDIRRSVVRDEFINKTREDTRVLMPINATYDLISSWSIANARPIPSGASANYSSPVAIPLRPMDLTITLPAGSVVNAMGSLAELKTLVEPYVGLININGTGAFPSWTDLEIGTLVSDASGAYGLTGSEFVIAVSFDDETQRLEFSFTNRLGRDAVSVASNFIDARKYRIAV